MIKHTEEYNNNKDFVCNGQIGDLWQLRIP
jgi:hypothetical protein